MKTIIISCIVLLMLILPLWLLNGGRTADETASLPADNELEAVIGCMSAIAHENAGSIVYQNEKYGFTFTLPSSWKGYKILTEKWEGLALEGEHQGEVTETGPTIIIRHPQWTAAEPRQDIPIMVFTLKQWNALEQEQFHIGAAPMGPTELGRNSSYVFALPARYNYAFLPGYEEVETILKGDPLKAVDTNPPLNREA